MESIESRVSPSMHWTGTASVYTNRCKSKAEYNDIALKPSYRAFFSRNPKRLPDCLPHRKIEGAGLSNALRSQPDPEKCC